MALTNYYFGSPDGIGSQMSQDRAVSAQERAAMMAATAQALQQIGLNRARLNEGAADRAERRYATDANTLLSRDLARGSTSAAEAARLEQARQFGLVQEATARRSTETDKLRRDELANLLKIAETNAGALKPQTVAPYIKARQEVDEWNATAGGVAANLNTRLEFLDAQEAKEAEDGGAAWFGLANNAKAAKAAAEKRSIAERALFEGLQDSVIYVTPVVDPATGKRRFKANTRTAPEMPQMNPSEVDPRAAISPLMPAPLQPQVFSSDVMLGGLATNATPEVSPVMANIAQAMQPVALPPPPVIPQVATRQVAAPTGRVPSPQQIQAWAQRDAEAQAQRNISRAMGIKLAAESQRGGGVAFSSEAEARAAGVRTGDEFVIIQNGKRYPARMN